MTTLCQISGVWTKRSFMVEICWDLRRFCGVENLAYLFPILWLHSHVYLCGFCWTLGVLLYGYFFGFDLRFEIHGGALSLDWSGRRYEKVDAGFSLWAWWLDWWRMTAISYMIDYMRVCSLNPFFLFNCFDVIPLYPPCQLHYVHFVKTARFRAMQSWIMGSSSSEW